MSAPVILAVPAPKLGGAMLAGAARIDRPLRVTIAPISASDGTPLAAEAAVGAFFYRVGASGEQGAGGRGFGPLEELICTDNAGIS